MERIILVKVFNEIKTNISVNEKLLIPNKLNNPVLNKPVQVIIQGGICAVLRELYLLDRSALSYTP